MNKFSRTYYLFLLVLTFTIFCIGCGKEETIVQPRNYFSGVMDGVPFANTALSVYKDTADIFTFVGSAGNGIALITFVNGKSVNEYPVTQGVLFEVSQLYDQTISLDSNFIDSIQTLIVEGTNNLPVGESYSILFSFGSLYYSNRGGFTLTHYDGTKNRIDGLLDIEVINIPNGPRYIQAFFEDVYYTDCPELGICLF